MPRPALGLVMALAGALIITPDTLLIRLSGLEGWGLTFWRGVLIGFSLIVFLDYNGRAAPGVRPAHHPARRLGYCHRYSEFFKVIALTFATMDTSITIVVTALANAPLITAALGVFTLAERPPLCTPP